MKVTLIALIEIEAEGPFDEAQLIRDFDGYMGECIGLPHGNVWSHKTGEDLGEIQLVSFDLYEHVTI